MVAGSQRNATKLILKDLVKLIAPYLVAIVSKLLDRILGGKQDGK
jgi:hypothetical protein